MGGLAQEDTTELRFMGAGGDMLASSHSTHAGAHSDRERLQFREIWTTTWNVFLSKTIQPLLKHIAFKSPTFDFVQRERDDLSIVTVWALISGNECTS